MKWWYVCAVLFAACGGLYTTRPDAGSAPLDGGLPDTDIDGGLSDAGTDGGLPDAGTDAGLPDAGTDGGVSDAGLAPDGGPFVYFDLIAPNSFHFVGVHGRNAKDVYVVSTDGRLRHYDGSSWTTVIEGSALGSFRSVWVASNGAVFLAAERGIMDCPSNCVTSAANYFLTNMGTHLMTGVCGRSPTEAYAVGYETSTGAGQLYRFNGNNWVQVVTDSTVLRFSSCWVSPQGEVFVAGKQSMVRYSPGDGGVSPEMPDFSPYPSTSTSHLDWLAIHGVGDKVFAAGSERLLATREPSGQWRVTYVQGAAGKLHSVAGVHPSEVVAMGEISPSLQMARFDGGTWTFEPRGPTNMDVRSMWAADQDTYFLVGQENVGGKIGVVVQAVR